MHVAKFIALNYAFGLLNPLSPDLVLKCLLICLGRQQTY